MAGIALLFFFGIPKIDEKLYFEAGTGNPDSVKGPHHRRNTVLTWIGFILVMVGFSLQIVSNCLAPTVK